MKMPRRSSTLQSEINVTPLVDVCLVLLIIFMVVTPLVNGQYPVELPETNHGSADPPESGVQISVLENGAVVVGATVVHREQLISQLNAEAERKHARRVTVRADRRLGYGAVVSILRDCRQAGYADVTLAVTARPA